MGGLARLSVVIPTHNRHDLLRRALHSVFAQSSPAAEVIVVDDGSTDGTTQMLRAAYPAAVCLEQPRLGVSAARNRGIEASRCDWIAFLDSDDEWRPNKLQRQTEALSANPRERVCHTDEVWIRDGVRVNPKVKHAKRGGRIFHDCLPLCCMSPSSIVIHRSVFDDVGTFDESLPACEDYDLWLRITAGYPVLFVDEQLVVKYGGHPDQLSRAHWGMDRFRIEALEKILASGRLDEPQTRAARQTLSEKISIYLAGARKREKAEEVALYTEKLRALHSRPSPEIDTT